MSQSVTVIEEKPEISEEQKKALLEEAILKREKLAESQLEMAKMFIENGKPEIAHRRLKEIVNEYKGAAVVAEARKLLKRL